MSDETFINTWRGIFVYRVEKSKIDIFLMYFIIRILLNYESCENLVKAAMYNLLKHKKTYSPAEYEHMLSLTVSIF